MIAPCLGFLALILPQRHAIAHEVERPSTELRAGAELRVHDVTNLTGQARLAAQEAELARVQGGGDAAEALRALEAILARRKEVESITKGLVEAVRDRMQPRLEGSERLEVLGDGRLALIGLPAQHEWLAGFLAEVTSFQGLIDIQARVYEVPRGALPERFAGRSGRALEPGAAGELTALLAEQGLEPTLAPRVLAFPFWEARLAMIEEIPYVKDFEVKVLPELEAEIADPVIAVAEDGTHLSLRAIPTAGGGLILYASLEHTRVARPIPTHSLELVVGQMVTVQLPEIARTGMEGHFTLALEEILMLLAPADPKEKTDVLVLLQAKRVSER